MSKQDKRSKSLIVGIVAAVVILAVLLVVLLTQCGKQPEKTGGTTVNATTAPDAATEPTTEPDVAENTDLYWNVDRLEYDGKSEGGMSSRPLGSDGYFHVRFFKDGEMVELRVSGRSVVNKLETRDLMGLVFDDDGIVVDIIPVEKMPVEKVGWKFYVQSVSSGGKIVKVNSSDKFNGMEVLLEKGEDTKYYDMTGTTGEVGCEAVPVENDRVMAVADKNGNLLTVYIYDRSNMIVKFQAYCQHCQTEVTWQEWSDEKTLPLSSGHYQLVNDIQLKAQQSTQADAKICLDLNGHRVDGAEGKRVYSLHNLNGELAIMDTSEEQTGTMAAHGEATVQGCVLFIRYGACYLYGGIMDASDVVTTHGNGGTCVYVAAQRFFYMNGGELIGGTAKYAYDETTGKYSAGMGATVYTKGKFVLNDGVIRDGYAQSVATYANGKTTYQRGIGGNVFISSTGVFEMNGGEIKNGKAGTGGNIFMDGAAELTINGGKITGGRALDTGRNGGNLYVGAKAKVVMNDGTISGGSTKNLSGNVHLLGSFTMNGGYIGGGKCLDTKGKVKVGASSFNMYMSNGARFEMYGGKIAGGVAAIDSSTTDGKSTRLVLSGYATIDGASEGNPNLVLLSGAEPVKVTVGTLRDRAIIGVTASGIFSLETKADNLDNFRSDVEGAEVLYYNNCLALGKLACLCGSENHYGQCDGTELLWGPWTSTTSLPTAAGNYYLINDVTPTGTANVGTSNGEKYLVNLDLNGHSVTSAGRTMLVYADLNITDHVGGGRLQGRAPKNGTDHTGAILMAGDATVGLYGGTVAMAKDHYNATTGGVFGIAAGATLNVWGGAIDGSNAQGSRTETITHEPQEGEEEGKTETVTVTTTVGKGGAIRLTGTLNIYGGTIIGGQTTQVGGAIYAEKNAKLNLVAGTIRGGSSVQGGNIYLDGSAVMTISGGKLTGGTTVADSKGSTGSSNGGNLYVTKSATLNLKGGAIEKGHAANGGGNVYANGKVNISGGKVSGGKCDSPNQPYTLNLMLINATTHISGGVIEGYVTATNTSENGSSFILSGKPVISGGEYNLRLTSYPTTLAAPVITIEGVLEEGAEVYMVNSGVISGETVEANVKAFHSDNSLYSAVLNENSCIAIGYVHCLCGHETHESWCDGKDLLWQPWNGKSNLTVSGNYYLTDNVTGGAQRSVGVNKNSDITVNLDLYGKTYASNGRSLLVYSNLNIVDSVGGGRIEGKGPNNDHTSTLLMASGSVVNLYQGTVAASEDHNTITYGGVVGIASNSQLNIYADGVVDGSKVTVSGRGGTIRVTGKLNICGGTVIGGEALMGGAIALDEGAELTMTSGSVTGGKASSGGNIVLYGGSTATITGGTVSGGEVQNVGGNIYLYTDGEVADYPASTMTIGGTAKIEGGSNTSSSKHGGSIHVAKGHTLVLEGNATVSGGHSAGGGGNIYFVGATLTIRDQAVVTGGTADGSNMHYGANIYQSNGTLNLEGGVVEGYISSVNQGSAVINLSGSPEVNKGTTNLRLTYTGTGVTTYTQINIVGELTGEHKIGIRMEDKAAHRIDGVKNTGCFVKTENGAAAQYESFFYADAPAGGQIVFMEDGLNVHGEGYRVACACGGRLEGSAYHTCEPVTWKPWKTANKLPTEGYWYLSTDIACASEYTLTGTTADRTLGIDLNGHTVTPADGKRIFRLFDGTATDNTYKFTLTITDNGSGLGELQTNATMKDQGAAIWITEKNQTVNLFGGHVNGGATTVTNDMPGAVISVGRGTLNIYGGTVTGSTITPKTSDKESKGGAIGITYNHNGGTVNMYGGSVVGGTADLGDAVYIDSTNAKFNVYGGSVTGSVYAAGSGLTVGGTANLELVELTEGVTLFVHESFDPETASVKVAMAVPGIFANNVAVDVSKAFTSANTAYGVRYNDDKTLELFASHVHCWCYGAEVLPEGHTCNSQQVWVPIESTPGKAQTLTDGDCYYLNWTGHSAQALKVEDNATVYLCLNGAFIRATDVIQLGENSKIVICDCSEGQAGLITTTGNTPLNVDQNATAILMSGTVSGTYSTTASRITVAVAEGATFEMYGGTLTGGCAALDKITDENKKEGGDRGGNLTADGTVKLMGGTITGGVYKNNARDITVYASADFTVGGKLKVDAVMVASGAIVKVIEKDLDAAIGITMAAPADPIAYVSSDLSKHFTSIHADYDIVGWKDGALYLGVKADHQHCFCAGAEALPEGHQCDTLIAWTAIEKQTSASTTLADGGHYYLNWTGASAQSLVVADGATAYLCLNGATIYAKQAITVGAGSTLHICDCSEGQTGLITVSGAATTAPILLSGDTKTVYLYGGNVSGTKDSKKLVSVQLSGGYGTFNMYGGTITGGYNTDHGGNVRLTGVNCRFNMFGGTISGGEVASGKHGGNIYMTKGVFTMNGGTITGGIAGSKGGNVIVLPGNDATATFTMNGGSIEGGQAANGGNVCVNATGTGVAIFTMNSGSVTGGTATTAGGNLYIFSEKDAVTVNGGSITGGTAAEGPCVYINAGTITVGENATVENVYTKP